ncbi:protein FAR1-RELATED SEQUENCE 5-like [Diospyros lotus]|uniref:protein FAR1-RELATED SEQUENCE 5-like n=1 Tax=Diospyros lotus TaxID=55363 RepID=UPI00224DBEA9|nr:protein FAR1-RELATED SEQUENCE 5-like [Diospyros lotus]
MGLWVSGDCLRSPETTGHRGRWRLTVRISGSKTIQPLNVATVVAVNNSVLSESIEDNEENCQDNEENCQDNEGPLNNEVAGKHSDLVPEVGMKFNDENEIYEFYKRYAYHVGFPIKKRNSKKDEDGMVIYVVYACSREGKRTSQASTSLKPKATIRVGCKAKITVILVVLGTWRISTVHLEHNHETSPSKSSYNSAVVEAGGYENLTFVENDCRNYIDKVRKLRLGEGDAASIQAYFSKMQALCPGFYFSVDLDEDSRLRNIFWADNRCRQVYKEFDDVVTFDTTYLTNRYDMPFAPFVGVNHHGQSTLFGCGLLSNEDTRTFVWLFRTWLQCMEDQAPTGIITDQDRAMQNAIEIVFPNTKHRWCLWHILKKLPEKFGNHSCKASILLAIHDVVYESHSLEVFEQGWSSMIEKYALHDNDWLSGLYTQRARWVPCFLKTSFWAAMSTTQRSESMNAFFDGYVHSKTSLNQFVEQYEWAMRAKVEKEFQADVKSFSQMVPCASRYPMEKQFQEMYTITKFKKFQDEFTGKMYCEVVSIEEIEEGLLGMRYEVREDIIFDEKFKEKKFSVLIDKEKANFVCTCYMFEFKGIICRHIVTVLIRSGIRSLPDKYIFRRWRKDVADDEDHTKATIEWMESQLTVLSISKTKPSCGSNIHVEDSVQEQVPDPGQAVTASSEQIFDPKCSQTKGAPRKLRKKGPLEMSSKKAKKGPMETSSKKAKVGSSKVNQGNSPMQNIIEYSQAFSEGFTQEAPYHAMTSISHSQLMVKAETMAETGDQDR